MHSDIRTGKHTIVSVTDKIRHLRTMNSYFFPNPMGYSSWMIIERKIVILRKLIAVLVHYGLLFFKLFFET